MSSSSAANMKTDEIITLDDNDGSAVKKSVAAGTNRKRKSPSSATLASNVKPTTTKSSTPPKKKKSPSKQKSAAPSCSYKVKIPAALVSSSTQKTMLVQITPEQQSNFDLEFEGSSGAIGRFEASDKHVTLDLKGHQFCGVLHSGPTAMIVSLVGNKPGMTKKTPNDGDGTGDEQPRVAKVEAIMNEFVTLEQTQDIMSMLDGTVDKGTIGNDDNDDEDGDQDNDHDGDDSTNGSNNNKNDTHDNNKELKSKTKNKEIKSNVKQKKANANRRKS